MIYSPCANDVIANVYDIRMLFMFRWSQKSKSARGVPKPTKVSNGLELVRLYEFTMFGAKWIDNVLAEVIEHVYVKIR